MGYLDDIELDADMTETSFTEGCLDMAIEFKKNLINIVDPLARYLAERYGDGVVLMVRDVQAELGLRGWTKRDSEALLGWLREHYEIPNGSSGCEPPPRLCHNIQQAAHLAGVGVHTVQGWLRRTHHPLPHFRAGRRFLISHEELLLWLSEESARTTQGFGQGGAV